MIRIVLFLFLFITSLLSQNHLLISEQNKIIQDFEVGMYEDSSASLSFEEIQKVQDFKTHTNKVSLGYSQSAYWFKFVIENTRALESDYFLQFSENHTHELDYYLESANGTYIHEKAGIATYVKDVNPHEKPKFELNLPQGEVKTIYVRIFSKYPSYTSFEILDKDMLEKKKSSYDTFYSFYFGAISALLLYNLFLYLFSRDRAFLFYVLYVSAFLTWQMQLNDFFPLDTYSSISSYYSLSVSTPLFIAFFMFFSRSILDTKILFPRTDRFVQYMGYLYLFLSFTSLFYLYYSYVIINALATLMIPYLLYIGFKSYFAGNKTALYYVVAQISFLFTSTFFSLMADGYIEYNLFTRHSIALGSFIEIVLFSLALAYKIKYLQDEKMMIISSSNSELEKKVKERTQELLEHQIDLQKKVQEEVKKSSDKDKMIFHQSKLISMGEMIENIAHQWRQPLMQINSAVLVIDDILMENSTHNQEVEEKLNEIELVTIYMSQTINDFKSFFDKDKVKDDFNLKDIVNSSLAIIKGSLSHNAIKQQLSLEDDVVLHGYPSELQQVLLVLINNAKDVLVSREIQNPMISITLAKNDDRVEITVCDNAGGIDEDIIEKVFEPYFTTKHKSQGTGLGLYISKMIIEDGASGKLSVENKEDGACFSISL